MSGIEAISLRLEALGHRVTPSRRAVIAAVLEQSDLFTVEDLLHQCSNAGRATVFRTIRLLTDVGTVCRVLLEDGSLRYRVSQRGHHHHLVCTSCGRVQDLDDCSVADVARDLSRQSGYEIDGHWLEFYGRCQPCRGGATAVAGGSQSP